MKPNKIIERIKHQPLEALANFSKKVATETVVLLKNNQQVLPIKNKRVAVFGRIQTHYYKSGTGSGGLVNVGKVPSIIEALTNSPLVTLDMKIKEHYQAWIDNHPYDAGNGQWASEPWAQVEMEIADDLVKKSAMHHEVGVVIFGRTAGEDRDSFNGPGSYQLSEQELTLLKQVRKYFKQVVVVLNIGNMMDLEFAETLKIDGLVIAWHGGMYGALALCDVLTGLVTPSGKLSMTVVKDINDYPSHESFGRKGQSIYKEDIYVGYRYFETFKKEAVRYPFGFGLSYTQFTIIPTDFSYKGTKATVKVVIQNSGLVAGKEVVQLYAQMPQGKLGKPTQVLVGYQKTVYLKPAARQTLTFVVDLKNFASYDDEGVILKSAYVLEMGEYILSVGSDVRTLTKAGSINYSDTIIVEALSENMAPTVSFKRLKPNEKLKEVYVDVPLRRSDYDARIKSEHITALKQNKGEASLKNVGEGDVTLDQFISQLSVGELIELTRGEGMSSPKVTAGTAAAFGGVTPSLSDKGIPICCASDGPSGIRMDSGAYASSLPSGTAVASSFNHDLVEELYYLEGLEMQNYEIDCLLGPGLNIQRHPLNGRNFEYFSEDPFLTGMMATAFIKGLHKAGVDGTLKHFAANNQETDRFNVDAVVSERALREIYLKGFEMAVKGADARLIMTSYNPINGVWSASNYELNKRILRDEWGFSGMVMTDWWAKMNDFGKPADKQNTKAMIIAQNDMYMVIEDSASNSGQDNAEASFKQNNLSLAQLQTVARHILNYIISTPAFSRLHSLNKKTSYKTTKDYHQVTSDIIQAHAQLDALYINNEKFEAMPYITQMALSSDMLIQHVAPHAYVHLDKKSGIVIAQNDTDITVYDFKVSAADIKQSAKQIDSQKLIILADKNWGSSVLSHDKIITSNAVTYEQDILHIKGKTEFSYGVEVNMAGKYIFEVEIQVEALELAQVPFSIYVDGSHQSTLTLRETKQSFIMAKSFVIMDLGIHEVSFRFNQGGIQIKKILCIKHG